MMMARLSALRADRLYPPEDIPGTRFYYRLSRPQGHGAAEKIRSKNKLKSPIGNRTQDLSTSIAGPRPTASPRVLRKFLKNFSYNVRTLVDKFSNHTEVLTIKLKNSAALCSNRAISLYKYERPPYPAFAWRKFIPILTVREMCDDLTGWSKV